MPCRCSRSLNAASPGVRISAASSDVDTPLKGAMASSGPPAKRMKARVNSWKKWKYMLADRCIVEGLHSVEPIWKHVKTVSKLSLSSSRRRAIEPSRCPTWSFKLLLNAGTSSATAAHGISATNGCSSIISLETASLLSAPCVSAARRFLSAWRKNESA